VVPSNGVVTHLFKVTAGRKEKARRKEKAKGRKNQPRRGGTYLPPVTERRNIPTGTNSAAITWKT